jgi:hypothetical protein
MEPPSLYVLAARACAASETLLKLALDNTSAVAKQSPSTLPHDVRDAIMDEAMYVYSGRTMAQLHELQMDSIFDADFKYVCAFGDICKKAPLCFVKFVYEQLGDDGIDTKMLANESVVDACEGGRLATVQWLHGLGISDEVMLHHFVDMFKGACRAGSTEIMIWLSGLGYELASRTMMCMHSGAFEHAYEHKDGVMASWLLTQGRMDPTASLSSNYRVCRIALVRGDTEMLDILHERKWFPTDINEMLRYAHEKAKSADWDRTLAWVRKHYPHLEGVL